MSQSIFILDFVLCTIFRDSRIYSPRSFRVSDSRHMFVSLQAFSSCRVFRVVSHSIFHIEIFLVYLRNVNPLPLASISHSHFVASVFGLFTFLSERSEKRDLVNFSSFQISIDRIRIEVRR